MKTIKTMLVGIALLLLGVTSGVAYLAFGADLFTFALIAFLLAGVAAFAIAFLEDTK